MDKKKLKVLLKNKFIDIKTLRELRNEYDVTFDITKEFDVDIMIDNTILNYIPENIDFECSHWLERGKSYNEIIDSILLGVSELKSMM